MRKLTPQHLGYIALGLSIASVVVSMLPNNLWILGLAFGVASIVVARRLRRQDEDNRMATAAIMISIVGIIMSALMLMITLTLSSFTNELQQGGVIITETAPQAT